MLYTLETLRTTNGFAARINLGPVTVSSSICDTVMEAVQDAVKIAIDTKLITENRADFSLSHGNGLVCKSCAKNHTKECNCVPNYDCLKRL